MRDRPRAVLDSGHEDGSGGSWESTYPDAPFLSYKPSAGKWAFRPAGAGNGAPDRVTLRALAADGSVLAEQENDLEWTKDDPFNPCGSPVTTPPIVFMVGER